MLIKHFITSFVKFNLLILKALIKYSKTILKSLFCIKGKQKENILYNKLLYLFSVNDIPNKWNKILCRRRIEILFLLITIKK